MPRRTTACWTCRARKKKCDAGRPSCNDCTLRNITCYGYDEKPAWMDGGDAERDMLRSMEQSAKESYSQRRRERAMQRVKGPASSSCVAVVDTVMTDPPTIGQGMQSLPSVQPAPWPENETELVMTEPSRQDQEPAPVQPAPRPGSVEIAYSDTDLSLLMYYLDHVFYRICPFFVFSAGDKGRGWLMSLFLRTPPLFSAAVLISACDKAQAVQGPLSIASQSYHELEMKHIQVVCDVRTHLDYLAKNTGASRMLAAVEALVCIIHLVYFELWIPRKSTGTDWVMHMDAAAALLSSLDTTMATTIGTQPSTPAAISDFFPVQCLSDTEGAAFGFFLTQYTCYFVVSAVTLGMTPQSAESVGRTRAIFHSDQTKIRDFFGIEDWVMMTLLDIAVLREWKKSERAKGTLDVRLLARRAEDIENRIITGLASLALRKPRYLPPGSYSESGTFDTVAGSSRRPGPPDTLWPSRDNEIYMVTSTYLNAALLLLHIVVSGYYPRMDDIRQAVLQTLEALEYMREHCDVNIYSWPLCVAGCLALESEYPRFRALLPPQRPGQHPLVLTKWTLDIVERCWELRASQAPGQESPCWTTAMNDLEIRLLLF